MQGMGILCSSFTHCCGAGFCQASVPLPESNHHHVTLLQRVGVAPVAAAASKALPELPAGVMSACSGTLAKEQGQTGALKVRVTAFNGLPGMSFQWQCKKQHRTTIIFLLLLWLLDLLYALRSSETKASLKEAVQLAAPAGMFLCKALGQGTQFSITDVLYLHRPVEASSAQYVSYPCCHR